MAALSTITRSVQGPAMPGLTEQYERLCEQLAEAAPQLRLPPAGSLNLAPSIGRTDGEIETLRVVLPREGGNGAMSMLERTMRLYVARLTQAHPGVRAPSLRTAPGYLRMSRGLLRSGVQRVVIQPYTYAGQGIPTIGEAIARAKTERRLLAGLEVLAYLTLCSGATRQLMPGGTCTHMNLVGLEAKTPGRNDWRSLPCIYRPEGSDQIAVGVNHSDNTLYDVWGIPTYRVVGSVVPFA